MEGDGIDNLNGMALHYCTEFSKRLLSFVWINSGLCKLRCFPPVVLVWDPPSGLEVFPNLYHETVTVDSSPAIWGSKTGSESTTVLLLVSGSWT